MSLSGIDLTVYSYIKNNVNEDGVYTKTIGSIARGSAVSETATKKAIESLEKAGMLDITRVNRRISVIKLS